MKFRLRKIIPFTRRWSGYVMVLVALAVPVFLWFVNYSISKAKSDHGNTTRSSAAYSVGIAVLQRYNPGKIWSSQKDKIYSGGA
jgi:hypothetical protein